MASSILSLFSLIFAVASCFLGSRGDILGCQRYSRKKGGAGGGKEQSMIGRFTTVHGLQYLLAGEVDALFEARKKVVDVVMSLSGEPTDADVSLCGNCGDCKANLNRF